MYNSREPTGHFCFHAYFISVTSTTTSTVVQKDSVCRKVLILYMIVRYKEKVDSVNDQSFLFGNFRIDREQPVEVV